MLALSCCAPNASKPHQPKASQHLVFHTQDMQFASFGWILMRLSAGGLKKPFYRRAVQPAIPRSRKRYNVRSGHI